MKGAGMKGGRGVDISGLGARALAGAMARREISPVEVMRATLDRVASVNPGLTAIVSLRDREALMGEARLAEAALMSGAPQGWLTGVPVAVKDLADVKGLPTSAGAPFLAGKVAAADAGFVARMRAEGAIVIGKTNVPMFGLGGHSTNRVFGVTKNPYDRTRTAGGSSGGAGVALATGMIAVADGSDMMGSLRNPAAWNGVYGFRPTVGLIPRDGVPGTPGYGVSTLGPMAREIGDLAALLGTMSGGAFSGIGHGKGRARAQPRIGWLGDWGGAYPMEQGILALAEAVLARMGDAGWVVEPVAPPVSRELLWDAWTDLRAFAVAQDLVVHWRDPESARSAEPPGDLRDRAGPRAERGGAGPGAGAQGHVARGARHAICPLRRAGPARIAALALPGGVGLAARGRGRGDGQLPPLDGGRGSGEPCGAAGAGHARGAGRERPARGPAADRAAWFGRQDPSAGGDLRGGDRPAPDPRLGRFRFTCPRVLR
jgi:amidase